MAGCSKDVKLEKITMLSHYASGSAMEYINGKLYLAGDDMAYLLVLDTAFNPVDSITLIDSIQSPMPKAVKPDLEAATTIHQDGAEFFLVIGSGSLDPYRNLAWLVSTNDKQKTRFDLQLFYSRLKARGLTDLNIEGVAALKDMIILSARGDKKTPVNHLVFTSTGFWNEQDTAPIDIKIVRTGKPAAGAFSGVSGLEYSAGSDCLILTVSTENTTNSYDDGTIGKSYLWLVNDISTKYKHSVIVPDRVIDLEAADSRFHGQKIETASILSETESDMELALSADNDDGKTVLFRINLRK